MFLCKPHCLLARFWQDSHSIIATVSKTSAVFKYFCSFLLHSNKELFLIPAVSIHLHCKPVQRESSSFSCFFAPDELHLHQRSSLSVPSSLLFCFVFFLPVHASV